MTWPVLIPSTVAIPELSRIFLHQEMYGYFSRTGTYCLPLTMAAEAVDTGIPKGQEIFLRALVDSDAHCVQGHPVFTILKNRSEYLNRVRPPWIREAVEETEATVRTYEQSIEDPSRMIQRQILAPLRAEWDGLRGLIEASLFMGAGAEREGNYSLFTHDLSFFGMPPANLDGLLKFLKRFHEAQTLLSVGMTDRLRVRQRTGEGETVRFIEDPLADQPDPGFEHIDRQGNVRRYEKKAVRPLVTLEADAEWDVDIKNYQTGAVHPVYDAFQESVFHQSQIFLGLFLCAYYHLGPEEIESLKRDSPRLFFDDPQTAITEKLRRIGRYLEEDSFGFQATLVSHALTTFCEET